LREKTLHVDRTYWDHEELLNWEDSNLGGEKQRITSSLHGDCKASRCMENARRKSVKARGHGNAQ